MYFHCFDFNVGLILLVCIPFILSADTLCSVCKISIMVRSLKNSIFFKSTWWKCYLKVYPLRGALRIHFNKFEFPPAMGALWQDYLKMTYESGGGRKVRVTNLTLTSVCVFSLSLLRKCRSFNCLLIQCCFMICLNLTHWSWRRL